ncbi:C-3',4' desaturase CrtD [Flexibacter flexilis DSM 6793]|uniref:C-3',4' desaturase CrtD n=1 Tax=Flexibacter flexilis DSM 6793 TaxID=927664 RepID=A0A1I1DPV9_9BACT|nr:NAD(P)/FAD-dependent oxidoreductase [Flexibacter flexilis]SFB74740.1 C-3',4' desaturase CrtD [Flexibacter flexilis DSM 6793]
MQQQPNDIDVLLVGSGLGSLTAACLLAAEGLKVKVLEQNYLVGGCTSSYWRKGFVFEAGATTVVGLDEAMPLRFLLQKTGISLPDLVPLDLPMLVHLPDGQLINKYQNLQHWITEAQRAFPETSPTAQAQFWEFCYKISEFVWQTSTAQRHFPPSSLRDLWPMLSNIRWEQLRYGAYSFRTTDWLLKRYGLDKSSRFVRYINEQLLITAQNHAAEVNVLFGATALCYTNYTNYYVRGGLINLVMPLVRYIEQRGGQVQVREKVLNIEKQNTGYQIFTNKNTYQARFVVSGIPANNIADIYPNNPRQNALRKALFPSEKLNSAFQMGIAFRRKHHFEAIHHQIHLPEQLPHLDSKSIFVSLSHPADLTRSDVPDVVIASVSTHIPNPAAQAAFDKTETENQILALLEKRGFLRREDVLYTHSSSAKSWEKWTVRAFGFVGGYPQLATVRPWQMLDARLDGHGAYLCGDTAYPGQGVPGVVLSGLIAYEKLKTDWLK